MNNRVITKAIVAATAAVLMAPASWAAVTAFSQNFEALNPASATALDVAGFDFFGTVFDGAAAPAPYGAVKFGYGPFPAPTISGNVSSIATGEGGLLTPQGLQYLNVFSDYACCVAPLQGHQDPGPLNFDYVQTNVFIEQTIGPADVGPGKVWTLTVDAKLPGDLLGCEPTTTSDCLAFIKTLDPGAGFAQTNFITFDAQTLSNTVWTTKSLSINLANPALNGQILQFGFVSTSKQFGATGVYYDNMVFALAPDTDGDGIQDPIDNCRLTANALQQDANLDGYGNICDADINNSGTVTTADFGLLRSVLGQSAGFSATAAASDMNSSGTVTTADFGLLRARLGTAPGPSGLACAGTIPCPAP
jgi:hypothetical protein